MKWLKWAFGEAACRAVSMSMQKKIGVEAGGFQLVVLSTFVIGVVQSAVAGAILLTKGIPFFPSSRLVWGSILFGIGAFVNTVIAFMAYVYGANMAVYTFITLLAIVPGAFIDWAFFGRRLVARQGFGIALAVFAGWLVLKTPTLSELAELPLWAWLGLLNALGLSINQGITFWVRDVNPWVKNFWGGTTTFLCCVGTLLIFGSGVTQMATAPAFLPVLYWSMAIALVVIGIWTYNLIAYRDGAAIPIKNIVVNGFFLTLIVVSGYVFFRDTIIFVQVVGMLAYLGAFAITNNEAWGFLTQWKSARPA